MTKIEEAVQKCYQIADKPDCDLDFTEIIAIVVIETGVCPLKLHDAWSEAEDDKQRTHYAH